MPSLLALPIVLTISGTLLGCHVGAIRTFSHCQIPRLSTRRLATSLSPTALYAGNNRWWDGPTFLGENDPSRDKSGPSSYQEDGTQLQSPSLITREMEEEVMASARATMDGNTVSRAVSSLIENEGAPKRGGNAPTFNEFDNKKGKNSLRDLASSNALSNNSDGASSSSSSSSSINVVQNDISSNSWDTQQIAIASGATTFLLTPLVVPIIHSLLPPLIPFPSSVSVTGAALLGTLSYIVALGDPTDQSNVISGKAGGGVLGDGVEVGGAVSRIVGRTALQSVQTSAPRLKAAARAMVDYDSTTATLEELQRVQQQLSQTVLELESENEALGTEVALWRAVEDVSSMYKLEELKEMARYEGIKGYSTDGKNALLRRLIREGVLKLDLTPYY